MKKNLKTYPLQHWSRIALSKLIQLEYIYVQIPIVGFLDLSCVYAVNQLVIPNFQLFVKQL